MVETPHQRFNELMLEWLNSYSQLSILSERSPSLFKKIYSDATRYMTDIIDDEDALDWHYTELLSDLYAYLEMSDILKTLESYYKYRQESFETAEKLSEEARESVVRDYPVDKITQARLALSFAGTNSEFLLTIIQKKKEIL